MGRLSRLLTLIAWLTCSCLAIPNVQRKGFMNIPSIIHGEWYSFYKFKDVSMVIDEEKWDNDKDGTELRLTEIFLHPNPEYSGQGRKMTMLMSQHDSSSLSYTNCSKCVYVLWRTENVLQYLEDKCLRARDGSVISLKTSCGYGLPSENQIWTMFRKNPVDVNCETTFKGIYHFSYQRTVSGGGDASFCNNSDGQIQACPNPGSPHLDNHIFLMSFGKCNDIPDSYKKQVRYRCLGSWEVTSWRQYTYAAVADTAEKNDREKFRCLMTTKNRLKTENETRWTMSRFPGCYEIVDLYSGPVNLVLRKSLLHTNFLTPQCSLPNDISGNWLTEKKNSPVKINGTHIHFQTAFESHETYYSCQRKQDTYFLMTEVVLGKCDVKFVCIDIDHRQDGTVRYKMGNPHQLTLQDKENPDFMDILFREACSSIRSKFLYLQRVQN